MIKQTILLLVLSLFSFPAFSQETPDIAVLIKGTNNPYWKGIEDGTKETAKKLGLTLYLQSVQTDQDGEQQLNMCNTILLRKPKVLIFAAVNSVNLAPCLRTAMDKGVILVDIDGNTTQETAKELGLDVRFSVASNNYDLGKKAADYLKGKSGNVLVIEGLPGSQAGLLRVQGFKDNLDDAMTIVASTAGDWDRLKAADITNGIITQYPKLTAVFAANDMMALGAAETLYAKGITNVTIIGVDGVSDAIQAIQAEKLSASVAQLPYLMGKQAVEKANALLNGATTMDYNQYVPSIILDKAILDKNADELLRYLR